MVLPREGNAMVISCYKMPSIVQERLGPVVIWGGSNNWDGSVHLSGEVRVKREWLEGRLKRED